MIKLVIFDFDGVIVNEYAKHYEFLSKRIRELTEEEFKWIFEGNFHERLENFKDRDLGKDEKNNLNEYKKTIKIKSDMVEFLKKLSKRYKLGIITSARESGTNSLLKNSGLEKTFVFVYGTETNKSKVEKFKRVFSEFDFKPEECIFVTDTVGDVLEAKKVEVKSIAIDFGYHERERLEKVKLFKIASSFSEVEELLNKLS